MEREVMEYDEKNNCIRQTKRQNEVIQTIRNNTAKHNVHAHDVHYNKIRKKSKAKKPLEQERKRKKKHHSFLSTLEEKTYRKRIYFFGYVH